LPDEARRAFIIRLRDSARDAFIAAYRAATNALPGLDNRELLDFFLIEKAAYEVAYEAANRPACRRARSVSWAPDTPSGKPR